ncbi:unnamed protein product [Closterium sp. NIES-65]|nr:unnamed protein product [Closterium sp. NIES-65]
MLWQGLPHGGVQVVYDIRYGLRARNTYMTGEGMTWDFGAVVVTIQYTLYPEALAIDQVHETSAALSWAMDHIHEYGGDPSRIFLTGHSSGAHVCSMVVWRRFSGGGVFALSAMSPAIGGPARFVSSSPAPLFDTLMSAAADAAAAAAGAVAAGVVAGRDGDAVVGGASAAASFGASFDCPKSPLLVATAIPTTATTSAPSAPSPPSTSAIARSRALGQVAAVSADAAASLRPILPPSNLRHPTHLPRQLVFSLGQATAGVPPQEGEVQPQEGEVQPQEGEVQPQEGEVPPQEGEVPPQEGEVPPQEGEVQPQEGEVPPQEGEVQPQEGEVQPQWQTQSTERHQNKQ